MEEQILLSEVTNVLQPLQSQLLDALGKYIQSKTTCDQQLAKYMSQMQSIIDKMKKVHFVKPISSVNNIQDIIDLEIFVTKLRQFSQVNVHTGSYVVYVIKQNEEVADRLVDIVAEACADNEALKYTAINTYYAIIAYTIQVLDEHKFFGTLLADLHYNKKEFHAYTQKLISTFVDTDSGANKQVTAGSTPASPGVGEDEKREQGAKTNILATNISYNKHILIVRHCCASFMLILGLSNNRLISFYLIFVRICSLSHNRKKAYEAQSHTKNVN